jgi:hypothetical protein
MRVVGWKPFKAERAGVREDFHSKGLHSCNEHVAITLYRDFPASQPSALNSQPSTFNHLIQDRLPLRVVNH